MGMREMADDPTRHIKSEHVSPDGINKPTA